MRHLYFNPNRSVTIYTGSLAVYYKSYWLSLRPYLTPNDAGRSTAMTPNLRRYHRDVDNYLLVRSGVGFAADERAIQSSVGLGGKEVFHLKAQTLGVGWQQSLSTQYLSFVTFDVTNQEPSARPGEYVTIYSLSVEFRALLAQFQRNTSALRLPLFNWIPRIGAGSHLSLPRNGRIVPTNGDD